jgi:CBS domain-containing protein
MTCCQDVMNPVDASSCCTPQDTTAHAARAIRDSGCGCAPVVEDIETMKLVGVVTERDVCCGVAADDRRASDVRVEEIMRPTSACCETDQPIEDTRRKLHENRATSLPVMDEAGGCCGTVSIHSLEGS